MILMYNGIMYILNYYVCMFIPYYGIVCIFWNVLVCTLYNWSYLLDPVSVLHIYCVLYMVLSVVNWKRTG